MGVTAGGIHYPEPTDAIDISGDLQTLAEDVETYVAANNATQNASVAASLATIQAQANAATTQANNASAAYAAASTGLEISMIMGVFHL